MPSEHRLTIALAVVALWAAGCGGGKPGYCSDVDDLERSIKDIGSIQLTSDARQQITDALRKVEDNARAAVDSAKGDFPDETAAIEKSIARLKGSLRALADSPTTEEAAGVAVDAKAVVTSANEFVDATRSECD